MSSHYDIRKDHDIRTAIRKCDISYRDVEEVDQMLKPDEHVLSIAHYGSLLIPNTIYATNKRLIARDPYLPGFNVLDISYEKITNVALDKGKFSATIKFEAPAMIGVIKNISKRKAEGLVEIIRSRIHPIQKIK